MLDIVFGDVYASVEKRKKLLDINWKDQLHKSVVVKGLAWLVRRDVKGKHTTRD